MSFWYENMQNGVTEQKPLIGYRFYRWVDNEYGDPLPGIVLELFWRRYFMGVAYGWWFKYSLTIMLNWPTVSFHKSVMKHD
jgi:hypothetical protein